MKQNPLQKNQRSRNNGWIRLLMILSNSFVGTVVGFNTPGLLQHHSLTQRYKQQNEMRNSNKVITTKSKTKKTASMAMMVPHHILDSASSLIDQFHGPEIHTPMPINLQHNFHSVQSSWEALLSTMYSNGVTVPADLAALLESDKSIPPQAFDGEFVLKVPDIAKDAYPGIPQEAISRGKDAIDGVVDVGKSLNGVDQVELDFSVIAESTRESKKVFEELSYVAFFYVIIDFFVLSSAERDLYKEDVEEYGADVVADSMEGIVARGIVFVAIALLVEFILN